MTYHVHVCDEPFSMGDILSIHIRIMKSKDGPVLVARDWNVIGEE